MLDVMAPALHDSVSSEDQDEDVAFKVLNQDNLPMKVTVLKPFGTDSQKQKPNVIVLPTRRIIANLDEQKQNDVSAEKKRHLNQDARFTKALDAKLRKLQNNNNNNITVSSGSNSRKLNETNKKPFVTTVRKGQFLEPPPEIASLIGLRIEEGPVKKLYAYFSKPRVLNRSPQKIVHQSRCDAAAKVAGKDETLFNKSFKDVPLPYANLMFEKRIFRGSNFAPQSCEHMGDGESAAARAAEVRRRAMARRKAKTQQARANLLRLGSPPPVFGRKHEKIQTDQYLEELFVNPPVMDMCTQTDLFLERPVSPFFVAVKSGIDVETQIYPGELFDFDMEVQPIIEVLVGKTVEQSLIEVLEEEELAALREQQRKFLEIRAAETAEAQRIEEREKRLMKEKDRRLKDHEEGVKIQKEMEERIAGAVLMQGYLANLIPSVLEGLESEGYLTDSIKRDVDDTFMPWLMKEVTAELQEVVSSRDLLTDIVREILENRAEIYKALNAEKPPAAEEEEDQPTTDDLALIEHMKLKKAIDDEK